MTGEHRMTRDRVVERARSAIGHLCAYKLGSGGSNPSGPYPWNPHGECDCSGFAAWCLGVSRHTDSPWYAKQNGGWIETSAIVRDCGTPYGMFDAVPWQQARPGDLLVYGDRDGRQGHVGIISQVGPAGPTAAIHCSSGNFRLRGDAIQETGVALWHMAGGIVAHCALLEPEPDGGAA